MILSEKVVQDTSVGVPETVPLACLEGAGKESGLDSTGAMV